MKKKEKEGVLKQRSSRKLYIPFYLMIILLIGLMGFIFFSGKALNTFALICALVFVFFVVKLTELHRLTNLYEINPSTLIHTVGLVNRNSTRTDFFAISDVDITQTAWQRILNYGDIEIRLFSRDNVTKVKDIDDPESFVEFLEKCMANVRGLGQTKP
jgi:membrane protein YdbS with pleckstrin-like domain